MTQVGALVDTLQSADKLTGTGTNPTLNATLSSTVVAAPTLSGIETLNVQAQVAACTLDLSKAAGLKTLSVDASQQSLTARGIQNAVAVEVKNSVDVRVTEMDTLVQFADSVVSGTTDVAKLTLTSNGNASVGSDQFINLRGTATGGFETLEITANGTNRIAEVLSDSTVGLDATATAANAVRTIKVSGEGSLRVDNALTSTTTFDASANKGGVNVGLDNAGAITVTGGEGNDTFNLAANLANTDKIDGGAGRDTIRVSSTTNVGLTVGNQVSNVEILRVDGARATFTFDNDDITSIDTIVHNATNLGGMMTYQDMAVASASDAAKGLTILNTGNVTYNLKGVGSLGAINQGLYVKVGGTNAADAAALQTAAANTGAATGTISTDGSSLTLDVQAFNGQTATGTGLITANNITSLTIKGGATGEAFAVGAVTNTSGLLTSIDGSGFAGDLTVAGTAVGQVIKGGSGNDTLSTGGRSAATTNGDVLTGGAGNDTFTFATADSTALPNAAVGGAFTAAQKALFTSITDLNLGGATAATAVDHVNLAAVLDFSTAGDVAIANGGAATALVGTTFGGAIDTLVAAGGVLNTAGLSGAAASAGLFTWGGETFLVVNEAGAAATGYATTDTIVILVTGVSGTLDANDFIV